MGLFLSSIPVFGQLNKFSNPGKFNDAQALYEFRKSNWDGTHASTIFLYIADSNTLESFKWSEGDEVATLVTAIVSWKNFSVTQFENHKLRKGNSPEFIARLKEVGHKKLKIEVKGMEDSLLIAELPWQSYDFDFAGLSFIWRALKEKKEPFWFHIADVAMVNNNPKFVNKGKVDVIYSGYDMVNEKQCLKYAIDGPGLENRGGFIWVNPVSFMIEQYKISLPDEPGFENGMLRLVSTLKMPAPDWEIFKRKKLGE